MGNCFPLCQFTLRFLHGYKIVCSDRGFLVREETALGKRRAKFPDYPYTYWPYSMKQHTRSRSAGWMFFSTLQQLFCANTASCWFTTLWWKYSEWQCTRERGNSFRFLIEVGINYACFKKYCSNLVLGTESVTSLDHAFFYTFFCKLTSYVVLKCLKI